MQGYLLSTRVPQVPLETVVTRFVQNEKNLCHHTYANVMAAEPIGLPWNTAKTTAKLPED